MTRRGGRWSPSVASSGGNVYRTVDLIHLRGDVRVSVYFILCEQACWCHHGEVTPWVCRAQIWCLAVTVNNHMAFGKYSGYKLNVQKTQVLTFNYSPPTQLKDSFRFSWNRNSLKYLWIHLPKQTQKLSEMNYDPLRRKIKEDIQRWDSISFLSLSHRIDTVKMNVLPGYLFLFQDIRFRSYSEKRKVGCYSATMRPTNKLFY